MCQTIRMPDTSLLPLWFLSALALTAIYLYFKVSFSYWKKRGVPTLNPTFPFGDIGDAFFKQKNASELINGSYKAFDGKKLGGLYSFTVPSLVVRDPEVIKDILVRDFEKFHSRGIVINEKTQPLQGHLLALSGSKWRNLRVKLTPTFTAGKMKGMFGAVVECGRDLQDCLQKPANNSETIEIKDILARYSTDVIASCAFGIQCNCLKNPEAEFRRWGRKTLDPSSARRFLRLAMFMLPSLGLFFKFPPKDVTKYFMNMVRDTVEYRENNKVKRNDFMQLLIQLKNKTLGMADDEDINIGNLQEHDLKNNAPFEVTMDVIAAQAFVFFIAGFETSSATMTFCLYELAMNPDIQERVRNEIDTVLDRHAGNITYEAISEMEYLEKVVDETLRKYPPAPVLQRQCAKSTKIRGTDVTVEKGVQILVPILGLHHDPKYYPDPERFDPERFSEEKKKERPHFCYLPFGEGPRICIGMRFGLMETKVGLISVLSSYEVRVSGKTPIPLAFDPKSIILSALGGMWLTVVKRSDK